MGKSATSFHNPSSVADELLACISLRGGNNLHDSELRLSSGVVPLTMTNNDGEITQLLKAMKSGDPSAAERLLPLVYAELHRLASSYMRRERQDHTLQPTALINEAYLRLAKGNLDWQNREHFIGVAAHVMRRVLVDYARAHRAKMRGGELRRVELEEGLAISEERTEEMLALDEALNRLTEVNPRQARVVELRYFGGLSVEQIAAVLTIGPRSVKRDWALARIWLFNELRASPQ
jgi:RNA polymerase sigma-70 factor (ECF subfamily)